MNNFDQTRESAAPDNIILNAGIVATWANSIMSYPSRFTQADIGMQPYLARGAALVRDIVGGTPGANSSLTTCDIPDNQLAGQLVAYVGEAAKNADACARGLPNALLQVAKRLQVEFPA